MIKLVQGDILKGEADALVNTVNCVGVMGRGIALQFRKAFPENFKAYKIACDKNEVQPGKVLVFDTLKITKPRYIINLPTKRHWKAKSRMEDIEIGLKALLDEVRTRSIQSIAVPPLGCGLGGLEWSNVRRKIEEAFKNLPNVQVLLYEPKGTPTIEDMIKEKNAPKMTVGRASLISLMRKYLAAAMEPFLSLMPIILSASRIMPAMAEP